mgnify:FL=1
MKIINMNSKKIFSNAVIKNALRVQRVSRKDKNKGKLQKTYRRFGSLSSERKKKSLKKPSEKVSNTTPVVFIQKPIKSLPRIPRKEPFLPATRPSEPLRTLRSETNYSEESYSVLSLYKHKDKSLSSLIQPRKSSISNNESVYRYHLFQIYQSMKFIKSLFSPDESQIRSKLAHLPKPSHATKTVVFDLDETLVHCCKDSSRAQVVIPWKKFNSSLPINIRPYARRCLKQASKLFEVIVFTASSKDYANLILDYLDPTNKLIHHRLYRESCFVFKGLFVKDLRILNRNLKDTVIIDNSTHSFAFQLENGIPIVSWKDDLNDKELLNLIQYFKVLNEAEDVRTPNRETFKLHSFQQEYFECFLTPNINK